MVNCRCVIVYVDEEDLENLTGDVVKPKVNPANPKPPSAREVIDVSPENQIRVLGRFVAANTPREEIERLIREAMRAKAGVLDDVYGYVLQAELDWHKGAKHWLGKKLS